MEAEKKRSKGGFLHLFDWNGKSRKKLFANNSEELPGSKQRKEDEENCSRTVVYNAVEADENEASSSNKGSSDWNSASCVTSEDGSGARTPGVVARLMGLDSLPTSNVAEPSSSSAPLSDSCSFRASHHDKSGLWSDFYTRDCVNVPNRLNTFSRNQVESRSQRQQNRPIERFQTQVLPPKSAKSIPITHHKLLSPIKNPGFVPTKNQTYIMEAAAKIIEVSPRASSKSKVSSIGPSSVPLRIRDLKEKIEAANKATGPEKSKEANALKRTGGQDSSKTPNGYVLVTQAPINSGKRNFNNVSKASSMSLAVQAKTNVQRREDSTPGGNRNFMNQKEVKSNYIPKRQPNLQRSEQKRTSPESSNNVLRQNNQKQNCLSNMDKTGKNLVSNHPARRTRSSSGSAEPSKTVNKVVANFKTRSKKTGSVSTASQRETTVNNVSRKKQSVCQGVRMEETAAGGSSIQISEGQTSIKCNISIDSCTGMSPDNRKPGIDVISFTFNSPLKKSTCVSPSSGQAMIMEKRFGINSVSDKDQPLYSNGFELSSPGFNVIGTDSLGALLEQKLQELTCKVQSYQSNHFREESSARCASVSQDSNVLRTPPRGKQVQVCLLRDKTDSIYCYDSPSIDGPVVNMNGQWQEMEESTRSSSYETGKELEYEDASPESSFELAFESGSSTGSKECSLAEVQNCLCCANELLPAYSVIDSPDSISSSCTRNASRKRMTKRFGLEDLDRPSNWELEYVRSILSNAELALEDFAMGGTNKVISSNIFVHLEHKENGTEIDGEECSKLGRKVLFDCVNECLESWCKKMFVGTCSRWVRISPRKEWLAEELYKEISGWKILADFMVDDLVDKDMNTGYGRWLDFYNEAFEEGLDIEKEILTSLVDELVSDLMIL